MKKTIINLTAVLILAIIFTSCGCKDEVTFYLPQDYKDCYVFPEGSWWIYNLNGQLYDTLLIIENQTWFAVEDECNKREAHYCKYSSNILGDNYDIVHFSNEVYLALNSLSWSVHYEQLLEDYPMDPIRYFGGGIFGMKSINELSIDKQKSLTSGYWLEEIRDSLINNNQYELRVYHTIDSTFLFNQDPWLLEIIDNLPPYKVYYARGIGIIRKEMYNGDVWTLEEHFINE